MKWFLSLLISAATCAAQFASPFDPAFTRQPVASAAASCDYPLVQFYTLAGSALNVHHDTGRDYYAMRFQASNNWDVCALALRMDRIGSPTNNYRWAIYSDDGSYPDANLSGWSSWYPQADLPTTAAYVTNDLAGTTSLASGTLYWIVSQVDSTYGVGSGTQRWYYSSSGGLGIYRDADGAGAWTSVSASGRLPLYLLGTSPPPEPFTNSFEALFAFETGSAGDQVTLANMDSMIASRPPFDLSASVLSGDTNVFRISDWHFDFPSSYWWSNNLVADTGTRSFAVGLDSSNSSYAQWSFGANLTQWCAGFYFWTDADAGTGEQYLDTLYVGTTFSSTNNTSCPLYHVKDPPYWRIHGTSNGVSGINGGEIYGMGLNDTQWVTLYADGTAGGMAVYDAYTLSQHGTNSTRGFGGDLNWNYIRINNWMHSVTHPGKTCYFGNLVISSNASDFPLLPNAWPTNVQWIQP